MSTTPGRPPRSIKDDDENDDKDNSPTTRVPPTPGFWRSLFGTPAANPPRSSVDATPSLTPSASRRTPRLELQSPSSPMRSPTIPTADSFPNHQSRLNGMPATNPTTRVPHASNAESQASPWKTQAVNARLSNSSLPRTERSSPSSIPPTAGSRDTETNAPFPVRPTRRINHHRRKVYKPLSSILNPSQAIRRHATSNPTDPNIELIRQALLTQSSQGTTLAALVNAGSNGTRPLFRKHSGRLPRADTGPTRLLLAGRKRTVPDPDLPDSDHTPNAHNKRLKTVRFPTDSSRYLVHTGGTRQDPPPPPNLARRDNDDHNDEDSHGMNLCSPDSLKSPESFSATSASSATSPGRALPVWKPDTHVYNPRGPFTVPDEDDYDQDVVLGDGETLEDQDQRISPPGLSTEAMFTGPTPTDDVATYRASLRDVADGLPPPPTTVNSKDTVQGDGSLDHSEDADDRTKRTKSNPYWTCTSCGFAENPEDESSCRKCDARPKVIDSSEGGWGSLFESLNKGWKCESCSSFNPESATACKACEVPRAGTTTTASAATSSKLSFGASPPSDVSAVSKSTTSGSTKVGGFTFGGTPSSTAAPASSGFQFGSPPPPTSNNASGEFSSDSKPSGGVTEASKGFVFGATSSTSSQKSTNQPPSGGFTFGQGDAGSGFQFGSQSKTDAEKQETASLVPPKPAPAPGGFSFAATPTSQGTKPIPTTTATEYKPDIIHVGAASTNDAPNTEPKQPSGGFVFSKPTDAHVTKSSAEKPSFSFGSTSGSATTTSTEKESKKPSTGSFSFGTNASSSINDVSTAGSFGEQQHESKYSIADTSTSSSIVTPFTFGSSGTTLGATPGGSSTLGGFTFGKKEKSSTNALSNMAPIESTDTAKDDDKDNYRKKRRGGDEAAQDSSVPATAFGGPTSTPAYPIASVSTETPKTSSTSLPSMTFGGSSAPKIADATVTGAPFQFGSTSSGATSSGSHSGPLFGGTPSAPQPSAHSATPFGSSNPTPAPPQGVFQFGAPASPSITAPPAAFGQPPVSHFGSPQAAKGGSTGFGGASTQDVPQTAGFGSGMYADANGPTPASGFGLAPGGMFPNANAPSMAPSGFGSTQAGNFASTNAPPLVAGSSGFPGFGTTPAAPAPATTFGFENSMAAPAPSANGFGQPPVPAPIVSGFGSPGFGAPTPPASVGFGQQTPTPASMGGGFGSQTPSAPASGGFQMGSAGVSNRRRIVRARRPGGSRPA
jgi:hypothetical protein